MPTLDRPAFYLLENFGPLAMGWVLASVLLIILVLVVRWFINEQKAWRELAETRSSAYHEVVKQNTETTAKQGVLFEERTREILEHVRSTRARR